MKPEENKGDAKRLSAGAHRSRHSIDGSIRIALSIPSENQEEQSRSPSGSTNRPLTGTHHPLSTSAFIQDSIPPSISPSVPPRAIVEIANEDEPAQAVHETENINNGSVPSTYVHASAFSHLPFTPARRVDRTSSRGPGGADAESSTIILDEIRRPDSSLTLQSLIFILIDEAVAIAHADKREEMETSLKFYVPYLVEGHFLAILGLQESDIEANQKRSRTPSWSISRAKSTQIENLIMRLQESLDRIAALTHYYPTEDPFRHQVDQLQHIRTALKGSVSDNMLRWAYEAMCGRILRAVDLWLQRLARFIYIRAEDPTPDDVSVISSSASYWGRLGEHDRDGEVLLTAYLIQATIDGFLLPSQRYDQACELLHRKGISLPDQRRESRAFDTFDEDSMARTVNLIHRLVMPPALPTSEGETQAGFSETRASQAEQSEFYAASPTITRARPPVSLADKDPSRRSAIIPPVINNNPRQSLANNPTAERMFGPDLGPAQAGPSYAAFPARTAHPYEVFPAARTAHPYEAFPGVASSYEARPPRQPLGTFYEGPPPAPTRPSTRFVPQSTPFSQSRQAGGFGNDPPDDPDSPHRPPRGPNGPPGPGGPPGGDDDGSGDGSHNGPPCQPGMGNGGGRPPNRPFPGNTWPGYPGYQGPGGPGGPNGELMRSCVTGARSRSRRCEVGTTDV